MQQINKLSFPVQNASINGTFRQLSSLLNSDDIQKDGYINVNCVIDCGDASYLYTSKNPNHAWFIYTNEIEKWVTFEFNNSQFHIEAYSLYNKNINDYYKYWEILISNNNRDWTIIDKEEYEDPPSTTTNTYYHNNNNPYPDKYIQMKVTGNSFGFNDRFALYGIDFFGTLYINHHTCNYITSVKIQFIHSIIPIICFSLE